MSNLIKPELSIKTIGITIKKHLATPDISLDEHVRQCQIALARTLEKKRAIYLDVNFWNQITDASIGASNNPLAHELLGLLRELVSNGQIFCPISDSTFIEAFKQKIPHVRKATAHLIDELSLNVALIPFDMRVGTELAHFIHSSSTPASVYPLDQLVWSRPSYVLGYVHPKTTGFDPATELAMQKTFFDHMWSFPFSEIVERIGDSQLSDSLIFDSLAMRLNIGNAEHADELRSFPHTYRVEIEGIIDIYANIAAEIMNDMAYKATGSSAPRGSEEWITVEHQCKNHLAEEFKKEPAKNALRTPHINACLHAYIRWNKGHKLEANHFYDFRHASAALGYCDVFLTERQLRDMVTTKHTALDKRYGCHVIHRLDEAVTCLREMRDIQTPKTNP